MKGQAMMEPEFHEFEFTVGAAARDIPQWMFQANPYRGRVARGVLDVLVGPINPGASLAEAFGRASTEIMHAARKKVVARAGEVQQPVIVDLRDVEI
jgi:hypothetical protein